MYIFVDIVSSWNIQGRERNDIYQYISVQHFPLLYSYI